MKLTLCYKDERLSGVFTAEDNIPTDADIESVEAHNTTTNYYDYRADFLDLYKVVFGDGDAVWIRARSFGEAVVDAALLNTEKASTVREAFEYNISEMDYNRLCEVDGERYTVYPPAQRLLTALNVRNRDFCALLLDSISCVKDDAELSKLDTRRAHYFKDVEALSSKEIQEVFTCWNSWTFFEQLDMSMQQNRMLYGVKKLADPKTTLFWSYALCAWGGCQCAMEYELYKILMDGSFDLYFDRYFKFISS